MAPRRSPARVLDDAGEGIADRGARMGGTLGLGPDVIADYRDGGWEIPATASPFNGAPYTPDRIRVPWPEGWTPEPSTAAPGYGVDSLGFSPVGQVSSAIERVAPPVAPLAVPLAPYLPGGRDAVSTYGNPNSAYVGGSFLSQLLTAAPTVSAEVRAWSEQEGRLDLERAKVAAGLTRDLAAIRAGASPVSYAGGGAAGGVSTMLATLGPYLALGLGALVLVKAFGK